MNILGFNVELIPAAVAVGAALYIYRRPGKQNLAAVLIAAVAAYVGANFLLVSGLSGFSRGGFGNRGRGFFNALSPPYRGLLTLGAGMAGNYVAKNYLPESFRSPPWPTVVILAFVLGIISLGVGSATPSDVARGVASLGPIWTWFWDAAAQVLASAGF